MRPMHVLEFDVALNELELGVLPFMLLSCALGPEFRLYLRRECNSEYTGGVCIAIQEQRNDA